MSDQVTLTGEPPLKDWYIRHQEDYNQVRNRLQKCRNILLHGDISSAVSLVKKGIINAIFSIRTELSQHEAAYMAWQNGDKSLAAAARDTLYGNRKAKQLQRQNLDIIARETVETVRQEGAWVGVRHLKDRMRGLGVRKAPFALSMCGCWELMCFDSNVSNYFNVEIDSKMSLDKYQELVEDACQAVEIEAKPFIIQWACYDFERGEHARHIAFFNSVGI